MHFAGQSVKFALKLVEVVTVLTMLPFAAYGQAGSRRGIMMTEEAIPNTASSTISLPAGTLQIRVDCGSSTAKVKTIAAGLKLLGNLYPAALLISGTCHENVVIQGLADLTLQGNPTATIDGGTDPNAATVVISGSQNIALNNLTITGGGQGLSCVGESYCELTQVTVQNSLGDGAGVGGGARLEFLDCLIQNNANAGLNIGAASSSFIGGRISGNASDGVLLRVGGGFLAAPADENDKATIQNNGGNGIRASLHNAVNLNSAVVTDNAVDGVSLQLGSAMNSLSSTISNNGGHQVRIGDLSVARFSGGPTNTVTGANFPDVACDPQFSTTRQLSNAPGATTNCPAELPPTP
jgi:parallel beta helix pectate lyase-like protein